MDYVLLYSVIVIQNLDAVAPVCILTWLQNPPAALGEGLLELLVKWVFQDCFGVLHTLVVFEFYDVSLWLNFVDIDSFFDGVLFNVLVQLALHGYLVDSVNVVVDLVRQ